MGRGPQAEHYTLLKLLSFPERFVFVPDHMVRWIPRGIRLAAELVAKHGIRVVLTSSPPASGHLIGLALQRRLGMRWVADFRDLWTEKKLTYRPATPLHDWWIRRLERRMMTQADHIIANTAENKAYYLQTFALPETRVSFIPNGFDRDDIVATGALKKHDGVFRIGYMGNLDKHAFPWQLALDAVKQLADQVGRDKVRFIHCGLQSDEVGGYLRRHDMQELMVSYGMLSHAEAMSRIAATDMRLLLLYETDYSHAIVPAKLYYYLIMPGPIVALAPEHGSTARILHETRTGHTLSPSQGVEAVYRLLQQYYRAWEGGALTDASSAEHIARYDYQTHTAQLVKRLCAIDRSPLEPNSSSPRG
jgi:hypothetical protein